jgi:hypothetical protein
MELILFNWVLSVKHHYSNSHMLLKEVDEKLGTCLFSMNIDSFIENKDTVFTDIHENMIDTLCELYPWVRQSWIDFLGTYEDVIIEYTEPYWIVVGTVFIVESPQHRVVIGKLIDNMYKPLEDIDLPLLYKKDRFCNSILFYMKSIIIIHFIQTLPPRN